MRTKTYLLETNIVGQAGSYPPVGNCFVVGKDLFKSTKFQAGRFQFWGSTGVK